MRSALAPIALLSILATACASPAGAMPAPSASPAVPVVAATAEADAGPTFEIPDVTARRITRDDLTAMLPSGTWTPLPRTNEDLVMLSELDREDESTDIVLHGRITGVGAAYADPADAYVWLDVLADPDAAHDYLGDAAGDIAKGVGGTHAPDVAAGSTDEFAVDVGDEAIGIVAELEDGSGTETLIIARAGRIVIFASHVHGPGDDARVRTQYLAEETLRGVVEVLTESVVHVSAADTRPYRFQTTTTITDDGGRTLIDVTGIIDGDARSCTIDLDGPGGVETRDFIEVGGLLWWSTGDGDFERVSPGNLSATAFLAACPAWPLDADAAGLTAIVDATIDPARHHVNGMDASGYQSDADGLASVFGGVIGADVDGFSFWVADESPWLVELAISMSGSADDRRQLTGPLVETIGDGTTTVRHRVFEVGSVAGSIVPPG